MRCGGATNTAGWERKLINPTEAAFKETAFIPRDIVVDRRDDGTILMSSRVPLDLGQPHLPAYLRHRAQERPDAIWISEPDRISAEWRTISFAEARRGVDSLTQVLLDLDPPAGSALVILSANSIEHALLTYAGFQAGIPVVPITPALALQPEAAGQLKERLSTGQSGHRFRAGCARICARIGFGWSRVPRDRRQQCPVGCRRSCLRRSGADRANTSCRRRFRLYQPRRACAPHVHIRIERQPKGRYPDAAQHHGCRRIESHFFWPKGKGQGVTRLDWMPWSHVTGAAVLAATLVSGGSFFIDDGKPIGKEFERTLENLRHVSPTNYFSMPAGYVMLADALEQDSELAKSFFANLLTMGYGGARLPDDVARRLQALAVKYCGCKIPFTCGYGSTETGPGGALVYWPTDRVGLIGLPHPGYELKLVPLDDERYEVRVRSDAVTPGYLGMPDQTAAMLDDEGYFRMGDAAIFSFTGRSASGTGLCRADLGRIQAGHRYIR